MLIYNIHTGNEGHPSCMFELKASIKSKYWTNSKNALKKKSILDMDSLGKIDSNGIM